MRLTPSPQQLGETVTLALLLPTIGDNPPPSQCVEPLSLYELFAELLWPSGDKLAAEPAPRGVKQRRSSLIQLGLLTQVCRLSRAEPASLVLSRIID